MNTELVTEIRGAAALIRREGDDSFKVAVADLLDSSADVVERLLRKGWPPSKVDFAARHVTAIARAVIAQGRHATGDAR